MVKSKIKEAIADWNKNNPTLRKKSLGSLAEELGVSTSSLSQIEASNQFQKHLAVVMESDVKFEQMTAFEIYRKIDIPIINKLSKIKEILGCEICDLVGK
jgi:transcriptional regulator with XRE-family HTH domain